MENGSRRSTRALPALSSFLALGGEVGMSGLPRVLKTKTFKMFSFADTTRVPLSQPFRTGSHPSPMLEEVYVSATPRLTLQALLITDRRVQD